MKARRVARTPLAIVATAAALVGGVLASGAYASPPAVPATCSATNAVAGIWSVGDTVTYTAPAVPGMVSFDLSVWRDDYAQAGVTDDGGLDGETTAGTYTGTVHVGPNDPEVGQSTAHWVCVVAYHASDYSVGLVVISQLAGQSTADLPGFAALNYADNNWTVINADGTYYAGPPWTGSFSGGTTVVTGTALLPLDAVGGSLSDQVGNAANDALPIGGGVVGLFGGWMILRRVLGG